MIHSSLFVTIIFLTYWYVHLLFQNIEQLTIKFLYQLFYFSAQLARKALDLMSGLNQLTTAENLHDLQKLAVQEGVKFLY
jgi:hypothetical protein